MADKNSNTMELDSILAEARNRRGGSPAPSQAPTGADANTRQAAVSRHLNDDFIVVDDDRPDQPYQAPSANNPRSSYDDYDDAPMPKRRKRRRKLP